MTRAYDTVVIGAGHNGLVCAHALAQAGDSVLVLPTKLPFPAYSATTVWVPTASPLVVNVATPPDSVPQDIKRVQTRVFTHFKASK